MTQIVDLSIATPILQQQTLPPFPNFFQKLKTSKPLKCQLCTLNPRGKQTPCPQPFWKVIEKTRKLGCFPSQNSCHAHGHYCRPDAPDPPDARIVSAENTQVLIITFYIRIFHGSIVEQTDSKGQHVIILVCLMP
jgi:hypothetical protein